MAQENNINEKSFAAAQDKLKELELKCDEYLGGWKRERADFINYKKEEAERVGCFLKYANEELLLKILPVLDNIYLAEKELPEEIKNNEWTEGFLQIKNQILNFLQKEGVEEIKTIGQKFDPSLMEVAEEVEGEEGKENGIAIEEVQKGYTLHGKVIRPAKVKVTK